MTSATHSSATASAVSSSNGIISHKSVAGHTPETSQHDEIGDPPKVPRPRFWLLGLIAIVLIASLVGLFLLGWIPRKQQERALNSQSENIKKAAIQVSVIHPRRSATQSIAQLPGDVQALEETTIYPRTSGYMKKWLVDIGDEVKEGQLLAEIDTPEIDQDLRQAEAALNQLRAKLVTAETNMKLAQITLSRNEKLGVDAVSQQEIDELRAKLENTQSMIKAANADIAAGVANVNRIKELQSFSKIYAPFSGIVTARNIELGRLVTSGNSNAQSLFRIAKTDTVRVFVNVPQMYAPGVKQGQSAELVVREMTGRSFRGTVTRTAKSIDPITRTLLTEVQVPNKDHALLTGSYVQVRIDVSRENPPLLIPATALIFNADGTKVAVVRPDYRIQLKPVVVEGDFATNVGIASGLTTDDQVVAIPGDSLAEGTIVQIRPEK